MDPSPAWQRRQQSSGTGEKNSRRPTGGSEGGSPLLKPRSEHPATPPLWGFQPQRGKKSTIDLQMVIIEKIKTIKTEVKKKKYGEMRWLTMLCSSFFVQGLGFFFCLSEKKEKKKKKNECRSKPLHRRCQIFAAASWSYYFHSPGFQCVWTFSLFSFILFVLPCLFLPLLKTLKASSAAKQHKLSCHLAQLWCFGR